MFRHVLTAPVLLLCFFLPQGLVAQGSGPLSLGWFSRIDQVASLTTIRAQGLSFVMPYRGGASREEVLIYLNRASALGLRIILKVSKTEAADQAFLRQALDSGAVAGFFTADEPELHKVDPPELREMYLLLKKAAPELPVAIVFSTARGYQDTIPRYRDCFDVFWVDQYPILKGTGDGDRLRNGKFAELIKNLDGISRVVQKPYWFVMQAFGTDVSGQPRFDRRNPSVSEMKYMLSIVLASPRATGVLFWSMEAGTEAWRRAVLDPLLPELLAMGGLSTSDTGSSGLPPGVQRVVRSSDIRRYVILINHGNAEAQVNPQQSGLASPVALPALGTLWKALAPEKTKQRQAF